MGLRAQPRAIRCRIAAISAGAALLATAVVAGAGALGAGSADAARVKVLGAAAPAKPACPRDCQVVGKVTGFQTRIGKKRKPFLARFSGRVVAWSIKLSKPNRKQRRALNDFFGGPPRARISVLQPIKKLIRRGKPIYRLKRQSPVENLNPFLGTTVTFTLRRPLWVAKGQIVALTLPTWAPAFGFPLPQTAQWRSSRRADRCGTTGDDDTNRKQLRQSKPQQGVGSKRGYWCSYGGARLLYSATLVRKPGQT